jgi:predicted TIM-barrel fold metal-dependent hydrolase
MASSTACVPVSGLYAKVNEPWLARTVEDIIDPERPIVDPHHHLWERSGNRYLFDEFLADASSGHNVTATVYVDCRSMYRSSGPDGFRPVGEVEFANGVAAMSASGGYGPTRICAGIVGHADLRRGDDVRPILEALIAAGNGRFRGIRQVSAWDDDTRVIAPMPSRPKGLLLDPKFREGFRHLAPLGLSFDAFLLHPQLPEVLDLARTFPETTIVIDHVGSPVAIGSYAAYRVESIAQWTSSMKVLATCDNVYVKLGGLGMRLPGFDFHERKKPAGSAELAEAWRPYIETCIEAFGTKRCMFESNFPPDKGTCSYHILWNTFKHMSSGYSGSEKTELFSKVATDVYRLAINDKA